MDLLLQLQADQSQCRWPGPARSSPPRSGRPPWPAWPRACGARSTSWPACGSPSAAFAPSAERAVRRPGPRRVAPGGRALTGLGAVSTEPRTLTLRWASRLDLADVLHLGPVDLVDLVAQEFDEVVARSARRRTRRRPGPRRGPGCRWPRCPRPRPRCGWPPGPSAPGRSGATETYRAPRTASGHRSTVRPGPASGHVLVDVVPLREAGDLLHEVVGEAPGRPGGRGRPGVAPGRPPAACAWGSRSGCVTVLKGRMQPGVDRLHLRRPHDADRDHRHAALPRQPGHPGAAPVDDGVDRPGALGVEAEQAARGPGPRRRWPGPARTPVPPPRRMGICPAARKNQAVRHESKYSALARKVTLRRTTSGRKKESQKDWWLAASTAGPTRRDVLATLDAHPPQQEEDRREQDLEHPVGHGQR